MASSVSFAQPSPLVRQLNLQKNQVLRQKLQRKVSVTWQGQRLAVALNRLASAGQVPLWLDRRVDRQQIINAQFVDLSLAQALENLIEKQSLGVALVKSLVYVGPWQAAQELTTLTEQARAILSELPAASRQRWLKSQPTSWPRLSEPRALAMDWLGAADIELIGSERIAHDLWPAQSLPALPLVDRLVLLLAGFDLTCQIAANGKACEVLPIRRPLTMTEEHLVPPTRPVQSQPKLSRPDSSLPGLVQPRHTKPRVSSQRSSRQLFSLRLENQPLGSVLDHLAQQLQLEIVWQEGASALRRSHRKQLVSCDLQKVELDELLRKVLDSAGLQYQLKDKRVTIQTK